MGRIADVPAQGSRVLLEQGVLTPAWLRLAGGRMGRLAGGLGAEGDEVGVVGEGEGVDGL